MRFSGRTEAMAAIELIDNFAAAMKSRVTEQSLKGKSGWDDFQRCPTDHLRQSMLKNAGQNDAKGLIDLAVYAAFIWNRTC